MMPNEFERQLPALLTRLAEDIPSDADLLPGLHQRLRPPARRWQLPEVRPAHQGLRTAVALRPRE